MALTKLTWEEVSQYKLIKSEGNPIFEHNGKYFIVIEQGVASVRRVFDLNKQAFSDYESGKKSSNDLSFYAQNDAWPPTENEKKAYYEQTGMDAILAEIKRKAEEQYNKSSQ